MKKHCLIIGLCVLLLGCSTSRKVPEGQKISFARTELLVPGDLIVRPSADQLHQIIDNDFNNNDLDGLSEYRIELLSLKDSLCSPSISGASKTEKLNSVNEETVTGRVDFWNDTGARAALLNHAEDPSLPPDEPRCLPPSVSWGHSDYFQCPTDEEKSTLSEEELQSLDCEQRQRNYELKNGLNSAYALCSKKDGKTVVICISQVTDNPALAEQIFSTFRWTD